LCGADVVDEPYLKHTGSNAKKEVKMFIIHSIIEIALLAKGCALSFYISVFLTRVRLRINTRSKFFGEIRSPVLLLVCHGADK
jgi:hypothetical protein